MQKDEICVVIPIYKSFLNDNEIRSVVQCYKVLSDYTIFFVAPDDLCMKFYKSNFEFIKNVVFFDSIFFLDIAGYNRLMLDPMFYEKFVDFKYMLIYQTDCYVFKDDLLKWAKKGYDYIGGIWFENYSGNPHTGSKIWLAGNGGLSLRKIKSISNLLSSKINIKDCGVLYNETMRLKSNKINIFLKSLLFLPLRILGFENTIKYSSKTTTLNEDDFIVNNSFKIKSFKIPDVNDALEFSWDTSPEYLYNLTGQLPFACHAWFRDDTPYEGNKDFWGGIITNTNL